MNYKGVFMTFGMAVSLMACSSQQPVPEPVSEPVAEAPVAEPVVEQSNKIELVKRGFSLAVSRDDNWNIAEETDYKVLLAKRGAEKYSGQTIQALVVNLPEFDSDNAFLAYMEKSISTSNRKSGLKVQDQHANIVAGKSGMCVQYMSKSEDARMAQKTHNASHLIQETVNYTCRHPFNNKVGVYLAYSRRYADSATSATENADDITSYATELFQNLEFSEI